MKKHEAIEVLANSDHAFLGKRVCQEIGKAFGFTPKLYTAHANPQDFKGLTLWDENGKLVDSMDGQDADRLAMQVCDHLDITYPEMYGRGSQLAVCVEALRKNWTEKIA